MSIPKIVILGAGYGGILTAQNLQKRLKKDEAEVTLVNKNDYHYLTTELHQPAAGTFPYQKTQIFLNELIDFNRINFVQDEVIKVDTVEQKVELKNGTLEYDYLVIGLGAEPESFGVKGIEEYAFSKWNIEAALELHQHIEDKFKNYTTTQNLEDLTVVVSGAGFTGIEFISELAYAVPELCNKYGVDQKDVRLISIDPQPTILPGFDPELVKMATQYLENKGVTFVHGGVVADIQPNEVILKDGQTFKAGTIVWAAGVRGSHVIDNSGFEAMRGRIKVEKTLNAPGFDNIFVVGDCSLFINDEQNRPYPPTAQISMQQGAHLAKNLVAILRKTGHLTPFVPSIKGTVASLGRKYAVGVVMGKKLQGFPAVVMKKVIDMRYLFIIGGLKMVFRKGRF